MYQKVKQNIFYFILNFFDKVFFELKRRFPNFFQRLVEHFFLVSTCGVNQHRINYIKNKSSVSDKLLERYHDKNAVLITTMQKSGTHLIINTLSNYLNNHFKINKKEKLSDLYKYFIVSIYDQKNETVINQKHYYKHIDIYETDISFFSGKKIFSYRNPFDQVLEMHLKLHSNLMD